MSERIEAAGRANRLELDRPDQVGPDSALSVTDRRIMTSKTTNISEAKASLSRLIERAERGERIIISRAGKPVAVLSAFEPHAEPRPLTAPWQGRVWVADDFDELPEALERAFGVADEP